MYKRMAGSRKGHRKKNWREGKEGRKQIFQPQIPAPAYVAIELITNS